MLTYLKLLFMLDPEMSCFYRFSRPELSISLCYSSAAAGVLCEPEPLGDEPIRSSVTKSVGNPKSHPQCSIYKCDDLCLLIA